jgi:hypothetical protein
MDLDRVLEDHRRSELAVEMRRVHHEVLAVGVYEAHVVVYRH